MAGATSQIVAPDQAGRLLKAVTVVAVITAAALSLFKTAAWLATGSVSLLASLVDSLMDLLASGINLVAVRYALTPADDEHRFGHGKAESLAGLGQATFIAGTAVFLVLQAIDRIIHPQPLTTPTVGIAVMAVATLATLLLVAFQRSVARRTGSSAVAADGLHYLTDVLVNLSIIAALTLDMMGLARIDAWLALAVAAYVFTSAWRIATDAVQTLMDRELPPHVQQQIVELARSHPQVLGVHDLRTRRAGRVYFVQLHLELDDDIPLAGAHAVGEAVAASIRERFPTADVLIHHDPVGSLAGPLRDVRAAGA